MSNTQLSKITRFRELHKQEGAFLIPNPWDVGSAVRLQSLGFKALASTSSRFAFTLGRTDMQVTLDEKIQHLQVLCAATDVPVNADFEKCFADDPEGVAVNIAKAVDTGVAGISIEDATTDADNPIFEFDHAVERVAAAVEAAHNKDASVVLTARAENFLWGRRDLDETIKRLQAFEKAGADVLYAPGLHTIEQIKTVIGELRKPFNALAPMVRGATVEQLTAAGVKRISVGGTLARAAIAAELKAAREMFDSGTFTWVENAEPNSMLQELMPSNRLAG